MKKILLLILLHQLVLALSAQGAEKQLAKASTAIPSSRLIILTGHADMAVSGK